MPLVDGAECPELGERTGGSGAANSVDSLGWGSVADLDPRALLQAAAQAAARLLAVDEVWIWLHDAAEDVVRLGGRVPPGPGGDEFAMPVGDSLIGRVLRAERPFVSADVTRDPLWRSELPHHVAPRSGLFLPLIHHAQPLGVLVGLRGAGGDEGGQQSDHRPRGAVFDEGDVRTARSLATHVAVAIQNAGLYRDARRQARQLAAIMDVNKQLALGPRLDEILMRIAEGATRLLGASEARVWLGEGNTLLLAATSRATEPETAESRTPLDESLSNRVASENRPIIFTDLDDPRRQGWRNEGGRDLDPAGVGRRDAEPTGQLETPAWMLRSWLGVPLRGRERVLGTIAVLSRGERRFVRTDVGVLEAFADQAAVAIENARLFREAATAEALRELARLKTEFLNTASHELRTPLSLIHGYAELLMHRAAQLPPERVGTMAAEIYAGSHTMVRLVDDMLDSSRLEQGEPQLRPRRVEVREMLGWLIDGFRRQPSGERIVAELDEGAVFVDPERLTQVVGNLLVNAIRYAPDGPILVRVDRRDGWLHVEVTDHGPGIPVGDQDRIWEKLYRGSLTRNDEQRGSGLGLAVVKHLVELHGGRVALSSVPGSGATFRIAVPAVEPASNG